MKSVLISINPKWCELIASSKKTIEVRKTQPKCETPFKCYIYCTEDKKDRFICRGGDDMPFDVGNGMVIGEFVCDGIQSFYCDHDGVYHGEYFAVRDTMLTNVEMHEYGQGKDLYGWHISDLLIYDQPKELSEFFVKCNQYCKICPYSFDTDDGLAVLCNSEVAGYKPLTRPPQSWCYSEELK